MAFISVMCPAVSRPTRSCEGGATLEPQIVSQSFKVAKVRVVHPYQPRNWAQGLVGSLSCNIGPGVEEILRMVLVDVEAHNLKVFSLDTDG